MSETLTSYAQLTAGLAIVLLLLMAVLDLPSTAFEWGQYAVASVLGSAALVLALMLIQAGLT